MTFKAPDSLAEQIAQHLAGRIIRGELKERERIREINVTQALNVSRGSVREALLILERRHLVDILPRRGAQVSELTPQHVRHLNDLVVYLYIKLGFAVVRQWRDPLELEPFRQVQERLAACMQRGDIHAFVEASFDVMRVAFEFDGNPYLRETLENLRPAVSRTYHLALEQRKGEMQRFVATFDQLMQAVLARDEQAMQQVLREYAAHNCALVLSALEQR